MVQAWKLKHKKDYYAQKIINFYGKKLFKELRLLVSPDFHDIQGLSDW